MIDFIAIENKHFQQNIYMNKYLWLSNVLKRSENCVSKCKTMSLQGTRSILIVSTKKLYTFFSILWVYPTYFGY